VTTYSRGDVLRITRPAPEYPVPNCTKSCCVPVPETVTVYKVIRRNGRTRVYVSNGQNGFAFVAEETTSTVEKVS
jgi:hypothetical protein